MRKLLLSSLILIISITFCKTKADAQTLKLELLLNMKNLPAKQLTGVILQQGLWQIESASRDSQHIVFTPVKPSDSHETIEIKRKPTLLISYYTQNKVWFDTLKREAIRLKFRLLNKETVTASEIIHTLQKDSAFIVEFHQTPSTSEIHLFPFQDYFRSFFVTQDEIWSKNEQYAYMVKCMSKMPQKLPFKYALKACGCGGQGLEQQMKFKFTNGMSVQELLLLIKPCIVYYEDRIENNK